MTLRSLSPQPAVGHADFLARADILGALGFDVLISRFEPLPPTGRVPGPVTPTRPIGIAVGLPALRQFMDEAYHPALPGGALESVGRLFKRSVKMYATRPGTRSPARIQTAGGRLRYSRPGTTSATCCSRSAASCRSAATTSPSCRFARPTSWPGSSGETRPGRRWCRPPSRRRSRRRTSSAGISPPNTVATTESIMQQRRRRRCCHGSTTRLDSSSPATSRRRCSYHPMLEFAGFLALRYSIVACGGEHK